MGVLNLVAPTLGPVASLTSSVTSFIGDYGLYAVFLLMVVDAVLPAASELVMLYAGALAAGAFSGQDVVLFGERIDSHFWAYVAMSLAGVLGNTVGSLIGWGIGAYGGGAPPVEDGGGVPPQPGETARAPPRVGPPRRAPGFFLPGEPRLPPSSSLVA